MSYSLQGGDLAPPARSPSMHWCCHFVLSLLPSPPSPTANLHALQFPRPLPPVSSPLGPYHPNLGNPTGNRPSHESLLFGTFSLCTSQIVLETDDMLSMITCLHRYRYKQETNVYGSIGLGRLRSGLGTAAHALTCPALSGKDVIY